jgi:MFS family permease
MTSQSADNIALTELGHVRTSDHDVASGPSMERRRTNHSGGPRQEISLPRADGGKDAWLFLAGCFCIEALVWGFPFSFGIFQDYYSKHELFSADRSKIAIIGTTATGLMYLDGPIMFAALQMWPRFKRPCSVIGLFVIAIALIASSFSTTVVHLILTQGLLYGLGGTLLYYPTILFLDEWFIRRKGMAFGIMWGGTGMSGVIIPFIMNWGLNKYGFATMLRAWAVTLVVLSGPLLFFVKPRIPITMSSQRRPFSFRFLRTSTFWILQTGNILEGLGFFIPNIYLPSYAQSLGLSSVSSTLTVALSNTTSVFGAILIGSLIDKLHVTTVILISTIGATTSIFLLWGLAGSLPVLCMFSLVYGLFAGGFSSTWTGVIKEVQKRQPGTESGILFGFLGAGRGIGSVVAGPLSEALLSEKPWQGEASLGYGSGYGLLIVFTGITTALGGVSWLGRRAGWI